AAVRQANPHAPAELLEVVASFGVRPGDGGTLVRKHDPFFTHTWPFRSEDHAAAWRRIEAPTLLVRAGDSQVLTAARAGEVRRTRPAVEYAELADCGHVVPVERPRELTETLRRFW